MKGIALLLPDEKCFEQANKILSEKEYSVLKCMLVATNHAVEEAESAMADGIDIIVARGRQAHNIKSQTRAIVVDIVITAQELGLLVMKAKAMVSKKRPRIGLFGWSQMLSDTSRFGELYDVELKRYILYREEDKISAVLAMERDGLDVVIAGEGILHTAKSMGIPGIYLEGTGESLRNALEIAENTLSVMEKQRNSEQQLAYIMDVMNQGVIKIKQNGQVSFMNATMERFMGIAREKVIGGHYTKFLKGLDEKNIEETCARKGEGFSLFYKYHGEEYYIMVDPIAGTAGNEGAVLIFDDLDKQKRLEMASSKVRFQGGKWVCRSFDDISRDMVDLQQIAVKARMFARSDSPILIEGVSGTEMELICEGIHSYSNRSNGPYYMINITGMDEEQQRRELFGNYAVGVSEPGLIEKANHGTLVIGSIDKLSLQNQHRLAQYLRNRVLLEGGMGEGGMVDTRIIVYTGKDLAALREKFAFRSELYFTLNSLKLRIPKLKERPADVVFLLEEYTQRFMKKYERYHILAAGAKRVLAQYPWDGNSLQLQSFCERMILTANKRNITEEYVRNLLRELYGTDGRNAEVLDEKDALVEEPYVGEEDPMKKLIDRTLRKYNGNRSLSAKELHMSTTTLWRKMKKFDIE